MEQSVNGSLGCFGKLIGKVFKVTLQDPQYLQKATSACANLSQKQRPAVKIRSRERNPILNPNHSCQPDNTAMHATGVI